MKITIFGNEYHHDVLPHIQHLAQELIEHGVELQVEESYLSFLSRHQVPFTRSVKAMETPDDTDVALSLGGDGTFLRTSKVVSRHGVPIMGINAGHLGYLTTAHIEQTQLVVEALLSGNYRVEKRSMLQVMSNGHGGFPCALNEVALLRQDTSSMIEVDVLIDGIPLTTYKGDGLLVCTPTGSTAYNLSVGGPVLEPLSRCVVLSPISPHALTMRPVVIRDDATLTITTRSRTALYQLSIDGDSVGLPSGTALTITRAPFEAQVVLLNDYNFASTLRNKLMWGKDNREE